MSEFPTINRYAVTLLPTKAFLDWAGACPGGNARMSLGEIQREPTVYLIPEATKLRQKITFAATTRPCSRKN